MKNYLHQTISVGDLVTYVTRTGSSMYHHVGVVGAIHKDTSKVTLSLGAQMCRGGWRDFISTRPITIKGLYLTVVDPRHVSDEILEVLKIQKPSTDGNQLNVTGVEAELCKEIARRQQVGITKYGTTVAANPLSTLQWIQHAKEEALDLAVYLERLKMQIE
jgi:hypothetical protein